MSSGNQLIPITEFKVGFDTYDEPENMPNDAFPELNNAHIFRGVLQKRKGFELVGILGVVITAITNANPGAVTTATNHGLTTGDTVNLVDVLGMTEVNLGETPELNPFTVTVTGLTTFTLGVDTSLFGVYIFPSGRVNILLPVQGLHIRQTVGFLKDLIAFNTTQAFLFNTASDVFDNISGATVWTMSDTEFTWPLNYQGSFFVTNNVDPIRYNITGTVWTNFQPTIVVGTTLDAALMIFAYHDRMIALSTTEGGLTFRQRVRFSQNGTIYVTAPVPAGGTVDATAWREDIGGKGNFLDAPTDQSIITAGFVRDVLVVVFDFSAWRLIYSGNEADPFIWQRLHSQLGGESTYSVVGFDDGILSVGRAGITISDTNAQKRIDQIIPDQVYDISNVSNAQRRVHGIRDYQRQLVYWTYPSPDSVTFPDKVLVYNYVERNWATYSQNFTTFGEFRRDDALIWEAANQEWQDEDSFWVNGDLAAGFPAVVAGDSTGNVVRLDPTFSSDNGVGYGFDILTKKFNPWINKGLQSKAIYMYLLISGTNGGEITIEHLIDEGNTGIPIATYTVSTNTNGQQKVWRRITLSGATSQYHQFLFTLSAAQLANVDISVKDVEIYHILLEMAPAGRLNYGITNV